MFIFSFSVPLALLFSLLAPHSSLLTPPRNPRSTWSLTLLRMASTRNRSLVSHKTRDCTCTRRGRPEDTMALVTPACVTSPPETFSRGQPATTTTTGPEDVSLNELGGPVRTRTATAFLVTGAMIEHPLVRHSNACFCCCCIICSTNTKVHILQLSRNELNSNSETPSCPCLFLVVQP
ncbi:hypothetical protein V8E51_010207 [Hyaloscypha variabilis]